MEALPPTQGDFAMRRRLAFAVLPILALAACQATPRTPELHNVYFTAESAALDDSARNTIAGAAREANASPATFVKVRGFAVSERSGPFYR
jgi:outer membrane protein OmpA-like peptidoglycan-associated protein